MINFTKIISNRISLLFEREINGTGIALFRILFSSVLLLELSQMYYFRHLIFDKVPYLELAELNFAIPLSIWMFSVVCLVFGFYTRVASIVNYIFAVIFFGTLGSYEYHIFYVYIMVSFLFMFIPISQCLSIDRIIQKVKYSNTRFQYEPSKNVSKIYYYAFLVFGVGFIYLDSVIFKLVSPLWREGLGFWLPINMPNSSFGPNPLNDFEFLVKGMSYITLFFELLFIFVFWIKKIRWPLFFIGVCLHLGILFAFPIPWFALAMTSFYVLFIPVGLYPRLKREKKKKSSLFVYYDKESSLCVKAKVIISDIDFSQKINFKAVQDDSENEKIFKSFSKEKLLDNVYSVDNKGMVRSGLDTYIAVFKRIWILFPLGYFMEVPGVYQVARKLYNYIAINRSSDRFVDDSYVEVYRVNPELKGQIKTSKNLTLLQVKQKGVLFVFLFVFLLNLASLFYTSTDKVYFLYNTRLSKVYGEFYKPIRPAIRTFLGVTQHAVFLDTHFNNYNHNISVWYLNNKGEEILLPIINEKGNPGCYISGMIYTKWTFRVNSQSINQDKLKEGIRDFTAFWAFKNNVKLIDSKFLIKVKKIQIPLEWEEGFYKKQIQHEWLDGGYVVWKDEKFTSFIYDIEAI